MKKRAVAKIKPKIFQIVLSKLAKLEYIGRLMRHLPMHDDVKCDCCQSYKMGGDNFWWSKIAGFWDLLEVAPCNKGQFI